MIKREFDSELLVLVHIYMYVYLYVCEYCINLYENTNVIICVIYTCESE